MEHEGRDSFKCFRRALTGEDKLFFDGMMQRADSHLAACRECEEPEEAIILSIMLGQEKEIRLLRQRR